MDRNSCRLCLSKGRKFVDALAVPELSKSVKSFFGFEILPTDLFSTIVCGDCVKTITEALVYKNRVVYNQECIREQMFIHSQIQNVSIKQEEEDDDDVILMDCTGDKPNDITQEVSSTQDCVPSVPQNVTKLTARKSTARQLYNLSTHQKTGKTLCPKKLKVQLKPMTEKDLKQIRMSKNTRSILMKAFKDQSKELPVKTTPANKTIDSELGKKLVKIISDPTPKKLTLNGTKETISQVNTQVHAIRLRRSSLAVSSAQSITEDVMRICSPLSGAIETNIDNSNVKVYTPGQKTSNIASVTGSKVVTIQCKNKPNGQSRIKMPNLIPAEQTNNHKNVQMSVVPFKEPSPKRSPIVVRRYEPSNSKLANVQVSGLHTTPPQLQKRPTATPAIPSAASIQYSIPGSTLTYGVTTVQNLSNLIPTNKQIPPKPQPQAYSQNMAPHQPQMLNSISNLFKNPVNKVKVLSVNELNTRVSSPSSGGSPAAANNTGSVNSTSNNQRLPIRISLTKVRNQMNIRLSNTAGADLHYSKLSEPERVAVRNSLLSKESIKRFAAAFLTTSPDDYTANLLNGLGLSVSSFF